MLEGILYSFFLFCDVINVYPCLLAIEADSPSLTIVRIISESPGGRVRKDDLYGETRYSIGFRRQSEGPVD